MNSILKTLFVCLICTVLISSVASSTPNRISIRSLLAEGESPFEHIFEIYDENADGQLDEHEFEEFYVSLFSPHEEDEHGHGHGEPTPEEEEHHHEEIKISSALEPDNAELCPLPDVIFTEFDADANGNLTEAELTQTMPTLLVMILEQCKIMEEMEESDCKELSTGLKWVSGLIASIIVSVISLVAIVLIPFNKEVVSRAVVGPLVAFGVGALVGDALMHLLPEAIGAHGHGAKEEPEDEKAYLGPTGIACLAILVFWGLEKMIHKYAHVLHHHFGSQKKVGAETQVAMAETPKPENLEKTVGNSTTHLNCDNHSHSSDSSNEDDKIAGGRPIGWLSLFADALHNLTDGFAMGVAFSSSFGSGIATTIAVVIHEIPQELGDYAILIKSGFSRRRALFFNFLSALSCVLGTIIGLGLGEISEQGNRYIVGFVAGGFLYVALAGMLPELAASAKKAKAVAIEIAAIILGFFIMFVLAYWVEDISFCGDKHSDH